MSKENSGSERGRANSRREFLKGVLLGGGVTAVALLTRDAVARPKTEPEATPTPESKGYRVTPHIQDYYRTAGL